MSAPDTRSGLPRPSPHLTTSLQRPQGKPGVLRLFFAVRIPDHIRERLMRVQGELNRDWRLVAPHQMHITLAFMGEVPEADLPSVMHAGERAVAKIAHAFPVKLGETGAFPDTRNPRIWFVEAQSVELPILAQSLHEDLKPWCDPKPFRPHLTLARRKAEHARFVQVAVDREWLVNSIELIRSELKPSGPVYTVMRSFPLAVSEHSR